MRIICFALKPFKRVDIICHKKFQRVSKSCLNQVKGMFVVNMRQALLMKLRMFSYL